MKAALAVLRWFARTLTILLLVIVGSTLLVRFAPGYLSDAREMDNRYATEARSQLSAEAARSRSLPRMLLGELRGPLRGDFGISRQFAVPVSELITPRLAVSGGLLLRGMSLGWMMALCAA
jgi:ABC-type dipeptide/oligopeptide/nickel transport system permease component